MSEAEGATIGVFGVGVAFMTAVGAAFSVGGARGAGVWSVESVAQPARNSAARRATDIFLR